MKPGVYLMQGNEACAEGAIAAGCRFYAGYPITPSSEIMERMAARMREAGGIFLQMEDEIASITAVIGASWAGVKAMTATSGPGFSLMQESIGYAAATETPIVVVDVQRSGPSTGQATMVAQGDVMQSRFGSHGDYEVVALSPSSAQEMFDLTVEAFNLSERFRVPSIILADAEVGRLREVVVIPETVEVYTRRFATRDDRKFFGGPGIAPMPRFGDGLFVSVTGSAHREDGIRDYSPEVHSRIVSHLCSKLDQSAVRHEKMFVEDAEILVVAYGITARSALSAVRRLRNEGLHVGFFRPITLWPSPELELKRLAERIDKIVLVEMSIRGYSMEVERIVRKDVARLAKIGGVAPTSREVCEFVRRCV